MAASNETWVLQPQRTESDQQADCLTEDAFLERSVQNTSCRPVDSLITACEALSRRSS